MNRVIDRLNDMPGMDLSGILQCPVFTSSSACESRNRLTQELVEHEIEWGQGRVNTALYRAQVGRCEVMALRYGAQVEIRPQPFEHFVLIQMPIRGRAELRSTSATYAVKPGEAAIFSPGEQASLLWSEDCEQLMVKVPLSLVSWGFSQFQPVSAGRHELPEVQTLQEHTASRLLRLVAELLDCMRTNETASSRWTRQVEESLTLFILDNYFNAQAPGSAALAPPSNSASKRVETFFKSRIGQETTLLDLATTMGVSVRSLHSICQREYGQSPMELLRSFRLEAVRERLLASDPSSVTQVALEYGFSHVGRFAQYYRERFGELPHTTARG